MTRFQTDHTKQPAAPVQRRWFRTLVAAGAVAAVSIRQATKRFKGFGELARKAP